MSRTQQLSAGSSEPADKDRPDAARDVAPVRGQTRPRPATAWVRSGSGYNASIDGRDYRVTKYPTDSPLAAPYGAYAEGRFIGSGLTLDNVKGRCNAHAARLRFRSRAQPQPEPEPETETETETEPST
jgi:hypothetical protein